MTKSERDKICGLLLCVMADVSELADLCGFDEWQEEEKANAIPLEDALKELGVE